jgi:hypothetical protein
MLTEQEVNKIFSWRPYREDWIVDRNEKEDNIKTYYGNLIHGFNHNKVFSSYFSQDGGLGNYLEFICYPDEHRIYEGNAILACVSLCAPVAAYGQIKLYKRSDSIGSSGLFRADQTGIISDDSLTEIEEEVRKILVNQKLILLDKEFASKPLPKEVAENLKRENLNQGNQYLHGIFQITD